MITQLYQKVISILFPPVCFICKKSREQLCADCLAHCKKAIETPSLFITSTYSFRDPHIKKIIHAIKYFHRINLIRPLVISCIPEITRTIAIHSENWILIPIPMPAHRKYMRGYNQAEKIADILSEKLHVPSDTNTLLRSRSPIRQVKTSTRHTRLKNQINSFEIHSTVLGKNFILIDDVTTTGATLQEARKQLLHSGAHKVLAITIAH